MVDIQAHLLLLDREDRLHIYMHGTLVVLLLLNQVYQQEHIP